MAVFGTSTAQPSGGGWTLLFLVLGALIVAVVFAAVRLHRAMRLHRRKRDLDWLRNNAASLVTDELVDYIAASLDAEPAGPLARVAKIVGRKGSQLDQLQLRILTLERQVDQEMVTEARVIVVVFATLASLASIASIVVLMYQFITPT